MRMGISKMKIYNLFAARLPICFIVLVGYSYEENSTAKWFNTTDMKQVSTIVTYILNFFLPEYNILECLSHTDDFSYEFARSLTINVPK